jgi:ABC-type glycerol-3-phosphate transport system substrate-binding protein
MLGACSKQAGSSKGTDEPIKLTFWAGNGIVTADEVTMPESEWFITKSIARFKATHPNVDIELVVIPANDEMIAQFRAATLAKSGPDAAVFMNGPTLLSIKSGLLELTRHITDDDRTKIVGWDTVAEDMDATKAIWGIPFGGQSIVGFAYNRSLIAKAGLDFDNRPPRSIPEFYTALDKIKTAGILPMHMDESYPGLILYNLVLWWVQQTRHAGIFAHNKGLTKYSDDKGFRFMLEEYKKFYQNGWLNQDTATSADEANVFLQGGSAIHYFGNWDIENFRNALGDDFGIMPTPSFLESEHGKDTVVGGVGAALGVSNFSNNPDMAVEFCKHLMSRDELTEYLKVLYGIPARIDISAEDMGRNQDPLFEKMVSWAADIYYWPDNCMDADYQTVFYDLPSQVLVGNMTVDEFIRRMDAVKEE